MLRFRKRFIDLTTETKRLPNGRVISVDIVRHPGAALIIPFLSGDTIIFIRQFRPVLGRYLYELPAGTIDRDERPIDCARREIVEETGFSAGKISEVGKIYPVPGYSTELITIFRAKELKKAKTAQEPDEIIKICLFKKSQVKRLFKKGQLCDAKTISALAFCGWL